MTQLEGLDVPIEDLSKHCRLMSLVQNILSRQMFGAL